MANRIKQIVDEQMMAVNSFTQYQQQSQTINNEVMDYLGQRFQFAIFQMEKIGGQKKHIDVLQNLWLDLKGDWQNHPANRTQEASPRNMQFVVAGGIGKRGEQHMRKLTVGAASREDALKLGRTAIKALIENEIGRTLTDKQDFYVWIVQ